MATGGSGSPAPDPSKSVGRVAHQQLSMIREELTCSLCCDLFTLPKVLPCLHNFCEKCLQDNLDKRPSLESLETLEGREKEEEARNRLVCPLCNDHDTAVFLDAKGVKGLKTNFSFVNLVGYLKVRDQISATGRGEGSPGTSVDEPSLPSNSSADGEPSPRPTQSLQQSSICMECAQDVAVSFCGICNKFLCSFCVQSHRRALDTRSHETVSLDEVESSESPCDSLAISEPFVKHNPWKCDIHTKQDVEMYCKTCKEVMCIHCAITKHKTHDYEFAHVIAGEYKKSGVQLLEQTEQVEQKFGEAIQAVTDRQAKVEESGKKRAQEVAHTYSKLVAELQRQKDQLLRRVDEITKYKVKHLQAQLGELTRRKDALVRSVRFAREVHENCIEIEFLFLHTVIEERLRQLCEQYSSRPQENPQENDAIQFTKNDEFLKVLSEANAIGKVLADAHVGSFTAEELDKVHFVRGKPSRFKVTARDIAGSRLVSHQDAIQVEIQPESGEAVLCPVVSNNDGTYTVTVHPQIGGPHNLTIFAEVGGKREPTTKSPYRVNVAPPLRQAMQTMQVVKREDAENKMKNPWGVVVTGDRKVVVSDVETNCLLFFDDSLTLQKVVGKPGNGELEFGSPRGLALTPLNHIVVAEKQNNRLQEVTPDYHFVRFFGNNKGKQDGCFDGPTGVAINSQGIVFATDSNNHRVQYFQADGSFLGTINRAFKAPYAIHIYNQPKTDREGHLEITLVTDKEEHHVDKFQSVAGTRTVMPRYVGTFGQIREGNAQLQDPTGIAVDPRTGYIFVAKMTKHQIAILSRSGELVSSFGSKGREHLQFHNPMNVAVLNATDIIVTDCANERIVVLRVLEE